MNNKNDVLNSEEIVYVMLEILKSNGTFDEFRRHCISNIDAKPTYQNWKQRIETNVQKFLSKINYTPELNKNTIRERLRKHFLDGRETHDIEEGADRILTQILAPRTLSIFEPKIEMAVNEYLGIKIEAPPMTPIELNGLKESNMNLKNVEISSFANPKIELNSDVENIEETSPEFEPLTSVLDNENSNDESISGMSDLVSVGSPIQFNSKEYQDANSNGFETDKNSNENPSQPISIDKNGINHKKDIPNIILDDDSKSSNNHQKLKTTDLISKNKHQSSSISKHTSRKEKNSTHRSKEDRNSSSNRSTSREKSDTKKRNSSSSKDGKNRNHNRHESKDKDKKHKHDKKSHHSDRDKTPKRDRKDSRSDKKEKSSSLCKEPKSLNGNRSDDESNAGGSSKQKSSIHKNKSSTSDKSKSSSSNHKSSRKDNGSKDVVDKPKDKSSMSKSSNSSSHKSGKSRKRSLEENSKLSSNPDVERKKPKWNDLESSFRTNDEKDAADVLLSMSEISYETLRNEVRTESIIFVENTSLKTSGNLPISIVENNLEAEERTNQNNDEENVDLKTRNQDLTQFDLVDSVFEKSILEIINSMLNIVCTDIEKYPVSCEDVKLENSSFGNVETISKSNKLVELVVMDEKETKLINAEVNSGVVQNTINCDSNEVFKVPKLKLKLLPNQIESSRKGKRKKSESNMNKKKLPKLTDSLNVSVPSIDIISPFVDDTNASTSFDQLSHKDNIHDSTKTLADDKYFKGFSHEDTVPSENYEKLKNFIKTLEKEENIKDVINSDVDLFRGFTVEEDVPCKNRDIVYKQLLQLSMGFKGFTEEETRISIGHKLVKQQLSLKKNSVDNQQKIVPSGKNGGSTFNKVMTILCESNKDKDTTTDEIYSPQNDNNKNDCPAVNNNNHNITASDHWVVEQEMKYKLLPVKVKIERLLGFRDQKCALKFKCTNE